MRALFHGRITLRKVRRADATALQQLLESDRNWLAPWEATLPTQQPNLPAPTRAEVLRNIGYLRQMNRRAESYPYVIFWDDQLVGQLNVSQLVYGAMNSATLGYWVHSSAAGRGIMPTAVALVTDFLLFERGLHRVEVCLVTDNFASYRVVQKLGFNFEGLRPKYIHINGQWRDHYAFSVTREDFEGDVPGIITTGLPERLLSGGDFSERAEILGL